MLIYNGWDCTIYQNEKVIKTKYLPYTSLLIWSTQVLVYHLTKCREPLDDYANFHLFGESSNSDLPVNRASTLIINCNMHTDKSNNYIEQI